MHLTMGRARTAVTTKPVFCARRWVAIASTPPDSPQPSSSTPSSSTSPAAAAAAAARLSRAVAQRDGALWVEAPAAATRPTRDEALRRWGAVPALGASGGVGDVAWVPDERMEFSLGFAAPQGWIQRARVRENHLSLDFTPPLPAALSAVAAPTTPSSSPSSSSSSSIPNQPSPPLDVRVLPSLHGLSISCFAYHRRVENPDPALLLHSFLERFDRSVRESLRVISFSDNALAAFSGHRTDDSSSGGSGSVDTSADSNDSSSSSRSSAAGNTSERVAARVGGAVCEIQFRPAAPAAVASKLTPKQLDAYPRVAHGLCRAFFAPNARFHYVVVFAVPSAEFDVMEDCVIHGMLGIDAVRIGDERRATAAARRRQDLRRK